MDSLLRQRRCAGIGQPKWTISLGTRQNHEECDLWNRDGNGGSGCDGRGEALRPAEECNVPWHDSGAERELRSSYQCRVNFSGHAPCRAARSSPSIPGPATTVLQTQVKCDGEIPHPVPLPIDLLTPSGSNQPAVGAVEREPQGDAFSRSGAFPERSPWVGACVSSSSLPAEGPVCSVDEAMAPCELTSTPYSPRSLGPHC